jgi:DNA-binding GntR family transcriptional regulator
MRGKGTFVAKSIPVLEQFFIADNLRDIVRNAQKYKVKLVSFKTIKVKDARISSEVKTYLNLSDEDGITRIQRIRRLNSVPIYFTENYLLTDIAKNIARKDLIKIPLLMILENKLGIKITDGQMTIEAIPADPEIAGMLNCLTYDPLILRKIYYRYKNNVPLEIVINFMRAEYFKYKTNIDAKSFSAPG